MFATIQHISFLQKVAFFDQLKAEIPSAIDDKMATICKHVDDVDLFLGGILENYVGTGALEPTLGCLVAEQFKRLSSGDRFGYENECEVVFNEDQLQELREVSTGAIAL